MLGVIPQGPATGSWPCRNGNSNYFSKDNPVIPEQFRNIDFIKFYPLINFYKFLNNILIYIIMDFKNYWLCCINSFCNISSC